MRSVWLEEARQELVERARRLHADAKPRWGRMTAPQMVVHVTDSLRSSLGELSVKPRQMVVRFSPLKELVIYLLPMPHNVPTAPELLARQARDLATEMAELEAKIVEFGKRSPEGDWPMHAAFGRLTGKQWGVLMYRHADHHFRQFGV